MISSLIRSVEALNISRPLISTHAYVRHYVVFLPQKISQFLRLVTGAKICEAETLPKIMAELKLKLFDFEWIKMLVLPMWIVKTLKWQANTTTTMLLVILQPNTLGGASKFEVTIGFVPACFLYVLFWHDIEYGRSKVRWPYFRL
jgi:hypothetical protein